MNSIGVMVESVNCQEKENRNTCLLYTSDFTFNQYTFFVDFGYNFGVNTLQEDVYKRQAILISVVGIAIMIFVALLLLTSYQKIASLVVNISQELTYR